MLEGFGVEIRWPLKIWCDSAGAISVKNDTCLVSKIRGAFDYKKIGGRSQGVLNSVWKSGRLRKL